MPGVVLTCPTKLETPLPFFPPQTVAIPMSVSATQLRKGNVLLKDGELLLITDYSHSTPGNWRAIIQIKTRNLITGQATSFRPPAGENFEIAFLEKKSSEYLYQESNGDYIFMDEGTYEQFPLSKELVGERMLYVKENQSVDVTFHDTTPIDIALPTNVVLEVTDSEMAIKGNSATGVKKDAVLETGLKIKVPMHIAVGEKIKVNTDTGEFLGRAQE